MNRAQFDALLVGYREDAVLCRLQEILTERNVTAPILSHLDYSSITTVYREDHATVTPDVPIVVRQWRGTASPAVSIFDVNELYAHLWSAVALAKSRVINRPTPFGHVILPPRSLVPRLWANAPDLRPLIPHEWYCDSLVPSATVEFETLQALPNETLAELPKRVRHRKPTDWIFARVTVVGETAWQASRFDHCLDWLCPPSLRIAAALDLAFCQVIWRVDPPSTSLLLARICPEPSGSDLNPLFELSCSSLADFLMS